MSCKIKYNTGNPLCSSDPRDLSDNAQIIDSYVNSTELTQEDRFGVERKTLSGINKEAQDKIDSFEQLIDDKIIAQGGVEIANEWGDSPEKVLSQEFLSSTLDSLYTPDQFGAKGDGINNDTSYVNQCISMANGAPVMINKMYLVDDDFNPMLKNIFGIGGFKYQNGNVWRVDNSGNHENIIYIADGGIGSGMSKNSPTTLKVALDRLKSLNKTLDGYYVIEFPNGVSNFDGVRLDDMPIFRKYLRIRGQSVPMNTEPTSIWDGANSTGDYALLSQNPQSFHLRIELENLYVKNFHKNNSGSTGFCVLWQQSTVYAKNVWADNVGMGISIRQGYLQVHGGTVMNSDLAYAITYNSTGNVGSLNDDYKVTILNCKTGVAIGRTSTAYTQGVHFIGCENDIECTRVSRFRSQKCIHEEWTGYCYFLQAGGVQTPDNSSGYPDTFIHSDRFKPVLTLQNNSTHTQVERESGCFNTISRGFVDVPKGLSSPNILASLVNNNDSYVGDFVPFRLPKYFLNTVGAKLSLSFYIHNIGTVGGSIGLYTTGTSTTAMLIDMFNIPDINTEFYVNMDVVNEGKGRLYATCRMEIPNNYPTFRFRSFNITSAHSELSEELLNFRLYVTSNGASDGTTAYRIRNMRGIAYI